MLTTDKLTASIPLTNIRNWADKGMTWAHLKRLMIYSCLVMKQVELRLAGASTHVFPLTLTDVYLSEVQSYKYPYALFFHWTVPCLSASNLLHSPHTQTYQVQSHNPYQVRISVLISCSVALILFHLHISLCVFCPGYESLAPPPPPGATAVPVWQDRTIASSKLRMLEYSAFMEVQRDPDTVSSGSQEDLSLTATIKQWKKCHS